MPVTSHISDTVRAVEWQDGGVLLLDQRRLPHEATNLHLDSAAAVTQAIRDMVVRGAPAIGIAAAYGVVLAARETFRMHGDRWREFIDESLVPLRGARPTAVNLNWAIDEMRRAFADIGGDPFEPLLARARGIHDDDIRGNRRIGELGAALVDGGILTHCNAGSLATGGYGTALGVVRAAFAAGRLGDVYATETRPWLQGARLTAWELSQDGIPVTLIADSAAGALMNSGVVKWVIVGADRIAANGDVANKIGTYGLAVMARHHDVRFMVAAPISTIDPETPDGAAIPIERRDAQEIHSFSGARVAAAGSAAWNPVFDVTPAALIDFLVTERGAIATPDHKKIGELLANPAPV